MRISKEPGADWIVEHREVWRRKPGLRDFYTSQVFARIIGNLTEGKTLQLGTGTGFFSDYHPGMVNSDIIENDGVDVVVDVHAAAFGDATFSNIVGVDVLHHFAKPGLALRECARMLRPGGRLVLVEPWAGPLGRLFYRYIHHEDCVDMADPWQNALPEHKNPLDGNAMIPITALHKRQPELREQVPGLRVRKVVPFGCVSIVLTGGFQKIGLGSPVVGFFSMLEGMLPDKVMRAIALKALFVMEKQA